MGIIMAGMMFPYLAVSGQNVVRLHWDISIPIAPQDTVFAGAAHVVKVSTNNDIRAAALVASGAYDQGGDCASGDKGCIADAFEGAARGAACSLLRWWHYPHYSDYDPSLTDEEREKTTQLVPLGIDAHGTYPEDWEGVRVALDALAERGWPMPAPDPVGPFSAKKQREALRFIVLGDSHSEPWRMMRHCSEALSVDVVESVYGATMLGLKAKRDDVFSTRRVYEHTLRRNANDMNGGVILHLGEVDAAHLVHIRGDETSMEQNCADAVERLVQFVVEVVEPHFQGRRGGQGGCEGPGIFIVPVVVTTNAGLLVQMINGGRDESVDVPWSERAAAAVLINKGVADVAAQRGWSVLEHPFTTEIPHEKLLGADGLHFKYSLAWAWLNEGMKRAMDGRRTCGVVDKI